MTASAPRTEPALTAAPADGAQRAWHALAPADVLAALRSDPQGLGEDEAARRLKVHGPNRLPQGRQLVVEIEKRVAARL